MSKNSSKHESPRDQDADRESRRKREEEQLEKISKAEEEMENSQKGEEGEGAEEAHRSKKYDIDKKHPIIGLAVFTILDFIALLFLVIATPLEWFKMNTEWRDKVFPELNGTSKPICVTAWGMKRGCRSNSYYSRDFTNTFCYRVRVDFKMLEAFCLMTIIVLTFGLFCGILAVFHKMTKGTAAAVGTLGMIFSIMVWGIPCGMYYQMPCCETTGWNTDARKTTCFFTSNRNPNLTTTNVPGFKTMGKYSASFGLAVTVWVLQLIAIVFAFIPL